MTGQTEAKPSSLLLNGVFKDVRRPKCCSEALGVTQQGLNAQRHVGHFIPKVCIHDCLFYFPTGGGLIPLDEMKHFPLIKKEREA